MTTQKKKSSKPIQDILWDLWCLASVVGIWPRFIEPSLLFQSKRHLKIDKLPKILNGLKIFHFSDLHFDSHTLRHTLQKISNSAKAFKPDLIVFTGDFLSYSILQEEEILKAFLSSFKAPLGCFAILGNHDYEKYVSVNTLGEYDVWSKNEEPMIVRGFKRLLSPVKLKGYATLEARSLGFHEKLTKLLKKTPFELLHNEAKLLKFHEESLNLVGFGDYTLGKMDPIKAFENYDFASPGVALLHNPDGVKLLNSYPVDVVLCGHTHGGQVNLPFLSSKVTLMEDETLKSGLVKKGNKWIYISRGVGSSMPFRWFSPPEVHLLTLERK